MQEPMTLNFMERRPCSSGWWSCQTWGSPDELMFVVGATRPEQLLAIRSWRPITPFGARVGAQGGRIEDVMEAGWIEGPAAPDQCLSQHSVCSAGEDYAAAAAAEAQKKLLQFIYPTAAHESIRQTPENRSTLLGSGASEALASCGLKATLA